MNGMLDLPVLDDVVRRIVKVAQPERIILFKPVEEPEYLAGSRDRGGGRPLGRGAAVIPRECKRLAEVDFPIAEVSRHAVREKSIRHGHPSTLHLWWARRPLASSRAVLLALLLPDPSDPHCPEEFKDRAREILVGMDSRPQGWPERVASDGGLRRVLLRFIADFANWDNAAKPAYLDVGRALVRAAHPHETPLVVDPFAGGGSIPLEALRLGCEAFASDLNPVACLILKVMLEDIPRHGLGLADELREVGDEIWRKAQVELAELYPADSDGATPIAYLWARTVRCESPNCGAEIPLMRSFWICRKPKRKWALRHEIRRRPDRPPEVEFEVFEPKAASEVRAGTVTRAKATCLCCGAVLPPQRVRAQLAEQRGGADAIFDPGGRRVGGARMTAVVTLHPGLRGRHYRVPTLVDYAAVRKAQERVREMLEEWENGGRRGICPVPDEPLPPIGTLGFRVQRYGMLEWGDLFTARQKVALVTLGGLVRAVRGESSRGAAAFAVSKQSDFNSSLARWANHMEKSVATFGRHALPILWDWGEVVPVRSASGGFQVAIEWISKAAKTIEASIGRTNAGQTECVDATRHNLPDQASHVWFTDPPYYDAIPYSDLSDYFLVWLKRSLPDDRLLSELVNALSPKAAEAVQDESKRVDGRPKDREWFEETIAKAFAEGRRVLRDDGVGAVVFAHKTTEGWEALLSGVVRGGWTITGSWPIATEKPDRMRAMASAALATSVHLICRPRPQDAPVGEWATVLRALPGRVGDWIERLQDEGVRGADLVFACIGPALEIFSRYSAVETPDGTAVGLPEYLERVWEVVGRTALEDILGTAEAQARNGLAGVLEEDARLTALFLWALQNTQSAEVDEDEAVTKFSLPFDVVRRFAQPMGIDLDAWTDRIIGQQKGIVRLLPVTERAKQLLGEDAARIGTDWLAGDPTGGQQQTLFPDLVAEPGSQIHRRGSALLTDGSSLAAPGDTTLDQVHTAMLYQARGATYALGSLIQAEKERGPQFLRLANALSALYPRGSEEKRLLDAMLVAI